LHKPVIAAGWEIGMSCAMFRAIVHGPGDRGSNAACGALSEVCNFLLCVPIPLKIAKPLVRVDSTLKKKHKGAQI
jgi:hypothetical protein